MKRWISVGRATEGNIAPVKSEMIICLTSFKYKIEILLQQCSASGMLSMTTFRRLAYRAINNFSDLKILLPHKNSICCYFLLPKSACTYRTLRKQKYNLNFSFICVCVCVFVC